MKKIIFATMASIILPMIAMAASAVKVTPAGQQKSILGEDYGKYDFGTVYAHSYNTVVFDVTNVSKKPLNYERAVMQGVFFNARHDCNRTLLPKQKCSFEISYWPTEVGSHLGAFDLYFKQESILTDLSGEAVAH